MPFLKYMQNVEMFKCLRQTGHEETYFSCSKHNPNLRQKKNDEEHTLPPLSKVFLKQVKQRHRYGEPAFGQRDELKVPLNVIYFIIY